MTGTIKTKTPRGFGFIVADGKPADDRGVFFHSADVVGTTFDLLNEGDRVTFDEAVGEKGPCYKNVALAQTATA